MNDRIAYRIAEVCKMTGMGSTYVYNEIAEGRLKAVKAGRATLVTAQAVQDWMRSLPAMHAAE
jgi:excisionase family DNA binding protein